MRFKGAAQFHRLELGPSCFLAPDSSLDMAHTLPDDQSAGARSNPTTVSRRSICRGIAAMVLPLTAGCSTLSDFLDGNPGEITVFNNTDSTITATTTVTNLEKETEILSETADIAASEATKYNDVFESATQYRFETETSEGLSDSYEWDLPSTDHYLYITVESDLIEFEENEP